MTEKDKAAQRTTLIFLLGQITAPLKAMAEQTRPPTSGDYHVATAQFLTDSSKWEIEVGHFTAFGEYRLKHIRRDISQHLREMLDALPHFAKGTSDDAARQIKLREKLRQFTAATLEAIDMVPIELTARLFPGGTPFSVCLHLRDAIATAKKRIHYFDRYLDSDFFPLYMRDLDRSIEIRLITTKSGVANVAAISKLAAKEFSNYQLIECS